MAARSTLTVTSGTTITSAWGNLVRDHSVSATTSNDVASEGQLGCNTSTDDFLIHNGSAAVIMGNYGGWYSTGWTLTCTQSFNVALSVTRQRWKRNGREIIFQANGSFTGNGSNGFEIVFSLPVTAAHSGTVIPGSCLIYDASAPGNEPGFPYLNSTTTIGILPARGLSTALLGASVMTTAVVSGDLWQISGVYEAAA
jgi:hypothetical protein